MRNWRNDAKIVLIVLIVGLIVSQAIRIDKSNPPVQADIPAPPEISGVLHRACYDCHSNETHWPWYANVAPVSWLLGSDVSEGRELLNFSLWGTFDAELKSKKLKKIAEEVGGGDMPPWYYTIVHSEARLGATDREQVRAWTTAELAGLGSR